jgi:apolipoprotein N-acyltransferase
MARMRALETARPMLRAANTGPSAIIDHDGRLRARAPQFKQTVLTGSVQRTQGLTPYVRFGDWLVVAIVMALIIAGMRLPRGAPDSQISD